MVKRVQRVRHSTIGSDAFLGREGEITVDLDRNDLRAHDGTTVGGFRIPNISYIDSEIADLAAAVVSDLSSLETEILATVINNAQADAANQMLISTGAAAWDALSVPASSIVARLATGNIVAATVEQILILLDISDLAGSDALNAVAALTPAADQMIYYTDANSAALTTLTEYMRDALAAANEAALHAAIGIGSAGALTAGTAAGNVPVLDANGNLETRVGGIPVGTIMDYGGTSAPSGCILGYGQAISRTTYAALFAKFGTRYGVGDGANTFNVPDFRGRVVAGVDNMGGVSADRLTGLSGGVDGDTLGAVGGEQAHANTGAENGPHVHGPTTGSGFRGHAGGASYQNSAGTPDHEEPIMATTASSGLGTAHNNVQPVIMMNKIIFTGVVP